jgi:ribonucleoside-diphosphate reductase beta chain
MYWTGTPENDQRLLRNLIAFYCVLEGIFFYCGFTQILRVNHVDTKVQVHRFITQDVLELLSNTVHLVTTTHTQNLSKATVEEDMINQIKIENPHLWTAEFQQEVVQMIVEGTMLEPFILLRRPILKI